MLSRIWLRAALVVASGVVISAVGSGFSAAEATGERETIKLVRSDPVRGGRMAPRRWVKLEFSGPLSAAGVQVQIRDDVGGQLEAGTPEVSGSTVTQRITPGISAGRYSITYAVAGASGRPTMGEVPFRVVVDLKGKDKPQSSYSPKPPRKAENDEQPVVPRASRQSAPAGGRLPAAPRQEPDRMPRWWIVVGGAAVLVVSLPLIAWVRRRFFQ